MGDREIVAGRHSYVAFMVTVRITTQVVQCDRCGGEGDTLSFEVETGRLTTRRRVAFDACTKCQGRVPLASWPPLGRAVRRGRLANSVVTLSEVDQLAGKPGALSARPLDEAVASYLEARAATEVTDEALREETRILKRFQSVNGNLYVRDVGRAQVGRVDLDSAHSPDFRVLDQLFAWCRRNKWMRAQSDPLAHLREGGRQSPASPLDEIEAGTCTACRKMGFVAPVAVTPSGLTTAHHRLCRKCRDRVTLTRLLA